MAQRKPEEERWLKAVLSNHLVGLFSLAMDVAVETGDPIGRILAEVLHESGDTQVAEAAMNQCPNQTVALRELAAVSTEIVYRHRRATWVEPDEDQQNELARLANNLGNRYSDLGRREEALQAAIEAVEIYRKLSAERPDAFLPDLAMSLNNLGNRYSDLGRREEAFDAAEEAVRTFAPLDRCALSIMSRIS